MNNVDDESHDADTSRRCDGDVRHAIGKCNKSRCVFDWPPVRRTLNAFPASGKPDRFEPPGFRHTNSSLHTPSAPACFSLNSLVPGLRSLGICQSLDFISPPVAERYALEQSVPHNTA